MDGGDWLSVAGVIGAALIAGYFTQGGASALRRRAIREELELADRLGVDTEGGRALVESARRRTAQYVSRGAPAGEPAVPSAGWRRLATAVEIFYWGLICTAIIAATLQYVL